MASESPGRHIPRWTYRLTAGAVILIQLVLVLTTYPISERGFIHPDDNAVFFFAQQVARTGVPITNYNDEPYANLSAYDVFRQPGSVSIDEHDYLGRAPPANYYLLAPAASISFSAALVFMHLVAAITLAIVYIILEKPFGGGGALAGTAFMAFHPSLLFWQAFLYPHLPALTFILLGIFFLQSNRSALRRLAMPLALLSILFRYEFAIPVGFIGMAWFSGVLRRGLGRHALVEIIPTFLTAASMLAVIYGLNGTFDIVGRGINQPVSGISGAAGATIGATQVDTISASWSAVGLLFWVPLTVAATAAIMPAPRIIGARSFLVGTMALATFFLGNVFHTQGYLLSLSYTRYLFPVMAVGAVGFAIFQMNASRKITAILLGLILAITALAGATQGLGPEGLEGAKRDIARGDEYQQVAAELGVRAVFIGGHASKWLAEAPVLQPASIPQQERTGEMHRVALALMDRNLTIVFGPFDREMRDMITAHPQIAAEPLPMHSGFWALIRA